MTSVVETTYAKDYVKHPFAIGNISLEFHLDFECTRVKSLLTVNYQPETLSQTDLVLDGEELKLIQVSVKGWKDAHAMVLDKKHYTLTKKSLTIHGSALPEKEDHPFFVESLVEICPAKNTQLSGLYKSHNMLCTQCEAEGFRRITFFIDRPDNMAIFTTTLQADSTKFPVLLSNGNEIQSIDCAPKSDLTPADVGDHTPFHKYVYHDPWPKPSYLFAIVAGDLSKIEDTFRTSSGVLVKLNLWCEPKDQEKLRWSMESVKKAMKWDEDTFGREFDLSAFHLVATPHFNMGAMENKGLNIFNSSCLLVSKDTGTDADYENCLACVGHEYFHNWTGNRVTCRDWFQLVIKEGLTTFREHLFTEDSTSAATARIAAVNVMKSMQFLEDSSKLAHSVVPASYKKIDNMYTLTVYRKGTEVIRMYHTILGPTTFRKALDLYFERHDGQGVTYLDFHRAMQDSTDTDINQIADWFTQVGTPIVKIGPPQYDMANKKLSISFEQFRPDKSESPLMIPIAIGLIGKESKKDLLPETHIFRMTKLKEECSFENIAEDVVPSILRNFSAPVKLETPHLSSSDLGFLMRYDSDPVNQWDAAQQLFKRVLVALYNTPDISAIDALTEPFEKLEPSQKLAEMLQITSDFIADTLKSVMEDRVQDFRFIAQILTLPNEQAMVKDTSPCDPQLLCHSHKLLRLCISKRYASEFEAAYAKITKNIAPKTYDVNPTDVGLRQLRNRLLVYIQDSSQKPYAYEQYLSADNLTARYAGKTLEKYFSIHRS